MFVITSTYQLNLFYYKETGMTGAEIRAFLAQNIKSFREHRQWSQANLAEYADISVPFLSEIERGNKWPYPDTLAKIANALNVEIYEFFRAETPASDRERDFAVKVVKEIFIAQKAIADKISKEYLG
ncbi:MAG: helix-turn-helix domain-containing protein [Tannerellaceae bacterium]|jgi:transcriptional regulator with XRE-family HTH domain|nr:helix-turn-helix domain-containing protein [Tannerellaceae bacterium]